MRSKEYSDALTELFLQARREENEKVRAGITGADSQVIERLRTRALRVAWQSFEVTCFNLHREHRVQYPNCPQLHFRCTTTESYKAVSFEANGVNYSILRFASDLEETGCKGSLTGLPESQLKLMRQAYRGWADYLEQCAAVEERARWAHDLQVKAGNFIDKNGNIVGKATEETEPTPDQ